MAIQHKTPGVYVEEVSNLAPSVAGVATAIPAFIGYTQCMPTKAPVKITSLLEYESLFGKGPTLSVDKSGKLENTGFVMYDSIRLFYDNGGSICYIVSVGKYPMANATAETAGPEDEEVTGDSILEGEELSAEPYKAAIDSLEEVDEVTLLACPDIALLFDYQKRGDIQKKMLSHCGKLKDRFAILDVKEETVTISGSGSITGIEAFRNEIGTKSLSYGAAYYPLLKSSYSADIPFEAVITYMEKAKKTEELIVARNLINNSALSEEDKTFKIKNMKATIPGYAEALKELQDMASVITPSGAVAGAIVDMDNNIGVWQAPANVSLSGIKAVTKNLTATEQEDLNVHETGKSINAIRLFSGKGILIWGARTLDGNDNEWRYIPVRRLFNYIEESIQKSTFWAVFQPNDANTWVKIKCQISNFLTGLWRNGALAGATPEDAFYVNVGLGVTMDSDDILNGNLIVQVGIAAVRPAEFIELKFSHKVQQ